jgi:nucleoside-diphosphate-sugar epimerase
MTRSDWTERSENGRALESRWNGPCPSWHRLAESPERGTMEILVTGATGFLARHLIPALQQRGHTVRALVLPSEDATWLSARRVAVYPGDVRVPETLTRPMRNADAVVHMAALMATWAPMRVHHAVHVTGTQNVCRAALAADVRRLVHLSSAITYTPTGGLPIMEHFPQQPVHEPHAVTKAAGDKLVQRMIAHDGLPAVIVRPEAMFGPNDRINFTRLADRLRAGKGIIIGSGQNAVPFVYVTDVVQGLLLALEHPRARGQAYNITNDRRMTAEAFLQAIADEVGGKAPRVHVPYRAIYGAAVVAELIATATKRQPLVTRHGVQMFGSHNPLSIEKARRELGYEPRVSLREGIRLAGSWYRHEVLGAAEEPSTAVSPAAA